MRGREMRKKRYRVGSKEEKTEGGSGRQTRRSCALAWSEVYLPPNLNQPERLVAAGPGWPTGADESSILCASASSSCATVFSLLISVPASLYAERRFSVLW